MNERIKQLAEQATTTTYEDDGWRLYATKVETFNKEKFAELIVRECMDVAYDHTPNSEECEYKRLIHNKIRQHFGVEQ